MNSIWAPWGFVFVIIWITCNRTENSGCEPHHESETKCKAFDRKISFACIWMKINFNYKNFALSLAFIMRIKATRKCNTNCKADTTWKSWLCETLRTTRQKPTKQGCNRGQLFRSYWNSSARCSIIVRGPLQFSRLTRKWPIRVNWAPKLKARTLSFSEPSLLLSSEILFRSIGVIVEVYRRGVGTRLDLYMRR